MQRDLWSRALLGLAMLIVYMPTIVVAGMLLQVYINIVLDYLDPPTASMAWEQVVAYCCELAARTGDAWSLQFIRAWTVFWLVGWEHTLAIYELREEF